MEDALVRSYDRVSMSVDKVLILVLMEDALVLNTVTCRDCGTES